MRLGPRYDSEHLACSAYLLATPTGGHSRPESSARLQVPAGEPPSCCRQSRVSKGLGHSADPTSRSTVGLGERALGGEVAHLPTDSLCFSSCSLPCLHLLLTVSKNNVFMPSTFCEPSAGNSDSEPGENSLPFAFHSQSLGVFLG